MECGPDVDICSLKVILICVNCRFEGTYCVRYFHCLSSKKNVPNSFLLWVRTEYGKPCCSYIRTLTRLRIYAAGQDFNNT